MDNDARLNRLLDYTKFHIGLYISFGGGLVGIIGARKTQEEFEFIKAFIANPWAIYGSLLFMAIAGLAGGIIASGSTQYNTFTELWYEKQGPFGFRWLEGRTWARIEHGAFWTSLTLVVYAVLC